MLNWGHFFQNNVKFLINEVRSIPQCHRKVINIDQSQKKKVYTFLIKWFRSIIYKNHTAYFCILSHSFFALLGMEWKKFGHFWNCLALLPILETEIRGHDKSPSCCFCCRPLNRTRNDYCCFSYNLLGITFTSVGHGLLLKKYTIHYSRIFILIDSFGWNFLLWMPEVWHVWFFFEQIEVKIIA